MAHVASTRFHLPPGMIKYSIIGDERGQRGFWRPLEQRESDRIHLAYVDICRRYITSFRVLSTTREIEEFFREIISYMTRNILMFGGVFFFSCE